MSLTTHGAGYSLLSAMADHGPATRDQFLRIKAGVPGVAAKTIEIALQKLKDEGYIVRKVFVTPAGLAELQRLGWAPNLEAEDR